MKVLPAVISFVLALQFATCFGAVASNYEDLLEASEHGHETGLANKEKRCHEPLNLPLYDHFLGNSKLLPSVLKRRSSPAFNDGPLVQMASRFKADEPETGLSEAQERYYTVGSFGPGPKQQILAKLLNIPPNVNLERLVVLARNKSQARPSPVPHPVVIDTAHVFSRNDGEPAELPLELHDVKGNDNEDINSLTSQLNKELDAAIDTKKTKLGDSHLTPAEIDKIIEHVVEQLKKKAVPGATTTKEIVGSTMDLTKIPSENEDDLEGLKKFKKNKGHKKHGFVDEDDDVVGDSVNLRDDIAEIPPTNEEKTPLEEETFLGSKKGYGHGDGLSKGHSKGKGYKGSHYRSNEDIEDENPQHTDMTEDIIGIETPTEQKNEEEQKEHQKEIEHLLEMNNPAEDEDVLGTKKHKFGKIKGYGKGYGSKGKGHYRENEDTDEVDQEEQLVGHETPKEDEDPKDFTLGTFSKFKKKGYGYDYDDGYDGYDDYDKHDKFAKGLKGLKGFGKFKGFYRENDEANQEQEVPDEEEEVEEPQLRNSQAYQVHQGQQVQQNPQFRGYEAKPGNQHNTGYQVNQGHQANQGYSSGNQYPPANNQQQYPPNQPAYEEPYDEYPENLPVYEQVEPEQEAESEPEHATYHGVAPSYPAPQSDNHYQGNYQAPAQHVQSHVEPHVQPSVQPQQGYQQQQVHPNYNVQPTYEKPKQYAPRPTQYQLPALAPAPAPAQPQAAYSSNKSYKSADTPFEPTEQFEEEEIVPESQAPAFTPEKDILGSSQKIPEDPTLKANFFENEVKRLRQWIADNAPTQEVKSTTSNSKSNASQNEDTAEKEELVDKFTKVIEKDLTDGKKLTPLEKKNLDRKIAKMVRDNLNDQDEHDAETKSRKKLDKLEELVEEEADENEENADDQKLGSDLKDLDGFKSRFASKNQKDDEKTSEDNSTTKKQQKPAFGHLLRASLDNFKKDMTTKKPILDLKNIVEDLKEMPSKIADMIKPTSSTPKTPKMGLRSGLAESNLQKEKDENIVGQSKTSDDSIKQENEGKKEEKDDETVGCLEDLLDKKDDYSPNWQVEPAYHHDDHGYDSYRAADKKDNVLSNLEKLLHPNHAKKQHVTPKKGINDDKFERSEEIEPEPELPQAPEIKTIPELIKQLEENLEENLHHLPTLPAMRQNHNKAIHPHPHSHPGHSSNPPAQMAQRVIPKIQVNGEQFTPNNGQNMRPPLPEIPPRGMAQSVPAFQSRNFPEMTNNGPEHFDMPLPQNFQGFQAFPQQQQQQGASNFVGAPQPQPMPQQMHQQPHSTHFGKIIPEHLHDAHNIRLRDVRDQMKTHKMYYFVGDGIKLPLRMHRDEDGSFHLSVDLEKLCDKCNSTSTKHSNSKSNEGHFVSSNILGAGNPAENKEMKDEEVFDEDDVPLLMKTPNFDELDEEASREHQKKTKRSPRFNYMDIQDKKTNENQDYLSPIAQAIKEDVEKKINTFNKDVKDYYRNEEEIKKQKMIGDDGDLSGYLERRVGLLSNILGMLSEFTFEDV